jgi:prepilin-type N-terminal cleavage/methylation domain-containing protein
MSTTSPNRSVRPGLTLIELIVVLVILVGLAGIIIPMLPNMLGRTHTATSATNLVEVVKWVQTYEQLYFKFPTNWDALVDNGGNLSSYVPQADTPHMQIDSGLTQAESDALTTSGITTLASMTKDPAPAPWSATFNPYDGNTIVVAPSVKLRVLSPAGIAKLNLSTTGKYVVFGLGKASSMTGRVMAEAPIHFSAETGGDPTQFYNRFGVVFRVSDTAPGVNVTRATLASVVAMHAEDEGLMTAGDELREYFDSINAK